MTTRLGKIFTISLYERFGHHGQWGCEKSSESFLEAKDFIVEELAGWLRHSNVHFSDIHTCMGVSITEQEIIVDGGVTFIERDPREVSYQHPNLLADIYTEAKALYDEREAQRISDEKILERGKKRALLERLKKELENAD